MNQEVIAGQIQADSFFNAIFNSDHNCMYVCVQNRLFHDENKYKQEYYSLRLSAFRFCQSSQMYDICDNKMESICVILLVNCEPLFISFKTSHATLTNCILTSSLLLLIVFIRVTAPM